MNNPKIKVIQNKKGEWHWKLIARNGKSVLIGGETFRKKPRPMQINMWGIILKSCILNGIIEYVPRKRKNAKKK